MYYQHDILQSSYVSALPTKIEGISDREERNHSSNNSKRG